MRRVAAVASAWLVLCSVSATARAEVRVLRSASLTLDVPSSWSIKGTEDEMLLVDAKGELAIILRVVESKDLAKGLENAEAYIGKHMTGVQWNSQAKPLQIGGMEASNRDGTATYQGRPVRLGSLIVAAPQKTLLLVGVIDRAAEAAHQAELTAFIGSIQPVKHVAAPSSWTVVTPERSADAATDALFSVQYLPPRTPRLKVWADLSHNLKTEQIADALNKTFTMPRAMPIVFLECGTVNAFYTPEKHAILVCYELLEYFNGIFRPTVKTDYELGRKIGGVTMFTLMHELGHAFIGELELPATGKEEDAADQLASIILSRSNETGRESALAAAEWFSIEGRKQLATQDIAWYDEHSFNLERMFDIICILYGDNQAENAALVKQVGISDNRAARCVRDTPKLIKSWKALLKPHGRHSSPQ